MKTQQELQAIKEGRVAQESKSAVSAVCAPTPASSAEVSQCAIQEGDEGVLALTVVVVAGGAAGGNKSTTSGQGCSEVCWLFLGGCG